MADFVIFGILPITHQLRGISPRKKWASRTMGDLPAYHFSASDIENKGSYFSGKIDFFRQIEMLL